MYLDLFSRPFPIVLVKCWKVGHWNAKKLLKICQKSKTLLPKFQKLPSKFLDIFILTLIKSYQHRSRKKKINKLKINYKINYTIRINLQ